MPTEFKVAMVFNAVAIIVIAVVVFVAGYASLPLDSDMRNSVEIRLVPITPRLAESVVDARAEHPSRIARIEIPPEFQTSDFSPRPWVILPDGSVRFRD